MKSRVSLQNFYCSSFSGGATPALVLKQQTHMRIIFYKCFKDPFLKHELEPVQLHENNGSKIQTSILGPGNNILVLLCHQIAMWQWNHASRKGQS
jgi:hypothetical protein